MTPATPATLATLAIEPWLQSVQEHVRRTAPELDVFLDEYVGEARFGASIVAEETGGLAPGSRILEIGAGTLLLACGLQRAGYDVVALEPIGPGFSHMQQLREAVMTHARQLNCVPELMAIPAEDIDIENGFDYAFSINVMEHVEDVAAVLRAVWRALRPAAAYRFVCPNYRFPYEAHFDIPTLFSKSATAYVFRRRILGSRTVVDPKGTWESLNWISVGSVRRICRRELNTRPEFDREMFHRFIRRAISDERFQRRHSPLLRRGFAALDALGLVRLAEYLPPDMQPVMSCRIVRPA